MIEVVTASAADVDQFVVDGHGAAGVVVDRLRARPWVLGDAVEHLEPAPAALAAERVVGVGDALQLRQHELRQQELALHEVGVDDVDDAAVDDRRRVDDLVRHGVDRGASVGGWPGMRSWRRLATANPAMPTTSTRAIGCDQYQVKPGMDAMTLSIRMVMRRPTVAPAPAATTTSGCTRLARRMKRRHSRPARAANGAESR